VTIVIPVRPDRTTEQAAGAKAPAAFYMLEARERRIEANRP
jgi:hypothetical protein